MADEEHGRLAPEQKQQLLDFLNASPFYHHMGMEALDSEGGRSHLRLTISEEHKNLYGILHGGVIATLLDSTCSIAVASLLEPGEFAYTLDQRINYIGNARSGILIGRGQALHKGRKTAVSQGEIRDEEGNLIAAGMSTLFLFRNE